MNSITQRISNGDAEELLSYYPDNLIINRPDLKSKPLIFGEGIITIIFWGFWFYLWLPLISVIAWLLGFRIFYSYLTQLGGAEEFLQQFNIVSLGIFSSSGILALWSFYNLKRYGHHNKRTKVQPTNLHALATQWTIDQETLLSLQEAGTLHFYFDKNGKISGIGNSTGTIIPVSEQCL